MRLIPSVSECAFFLERTEPLAAPQAGRPSWTPIPQDHHCCVCGDTDKLLPNRMFKLESLVRTYVNTNTVVRLTEIPGLPPFTVRIGADCFHLLTTWLSEVHETRVEVSDFDESFYQIMLRQDAKLKVRMNQCPSVFLSSSSEAG